MKLTVFQLLAVFAIALSSCSSSELSRPNALELIKKEYKYPITTDWAIFTGDPAHAKKLLDAGLEQEGYVVVQRTQKMKDTGKPWISFTDKATQFLLPIKEEDKKYAIQKVRTGEEDIIAITGIKMLSKGRKAVVEYTTQYEQLTPFAVLAHLQANKPNTRTAYFSLYDDGWRVERKPGLDFMGE